MHCPNKITDHNTQDYFQPEIDDPDVIDHLDKLVKLMLRYTLHHHSNLPHFLDAIASPSTYPCQWVGESFRQWVIVSDLEIAIASPGFASLFN